MNRLSAEKQLQIIHLLVEGNSIRSVERLTRTHRDTIMRLLVRVGDKCREFLDRKMRGLKLDHVQVDEIWTFCQMKQGRVPTDQTNNPLIGDQYLFVGLDERTKLIPTFLIGKRTGENAQMFMADLADRMIRPALHEAGERPQISTDGFPGYPLAVDLAFANTVDYGVLIKNYRESEQPGRYGPPTMINSDRRPMTKELDPMTICTSHVERHNLSIRTFLRRFTRLALGFSKKLNNLAACVALYTAHYNFCRVHRSLKKTPAMAAGLTGHLWTLDELLASVTEGQ